MNDKEGLPPATKIVLLLSLVVALIAVPVLTNAFSFRSLIERALRGSKTPVTAFNYESSGLLPLDDLIALKSQKWGVDSNLVNRIIQCESGFNANAINYNIAGTTDNGYWQINNYWWEDSLLEKGWDIYIPSDNLEAGFFLISTLGTQPWGASKACWDK